MVARRGGISHHTFLNAENGTLFNRIYRRFIEHKEDFAMVDTIEDGLKRVLESDKSTFYYVSESIYPLTEFRCKWAVPWSSRYPNPLGMALAKENEYREIFQYFFIKKFEHGTVRLLNTQWKRDHPDCDTGEATALGWQKLVSLFLVFCVGTLLAVAIFMLEQFTGKHGQLINSGKGSKKDRPYKDYSDQEEKKKVNALRLMKNKVLQAMSDHPLAASEDNGLFIMRLEEVLRELQQG